MGPVIATRVADDHRAQRDILVALAEDIGEDGGKAVAQIAEEVAWFAQALAHDMDEEEANLLTPMALGEEYVVVDQSGG